MLTKEKRPRKRNTIKSNENTEPINSKSNELNKKNQWTLKINQKQSKKLNKKLNQCKLNILTEISSNNSHSFLNSSNLNDKCFNKKITDYFPIRKSTRRCKSELEKERRLLIEDAILNKKEEGLEVKVIENKGRGVFASRRFQRGEFVCEYAGELISYSEAKKREKMYAHDTNIGCYMFFFEYKSKSYCVDATAETNRLGRLLNHSKLDGNCHTKLFETDSKPYLIICAINDIKPGEELTFDYGDRNKLSLESHPWLAQ